MEMEDVLGMYRIFLEAPVPVMVCPDCGSVKTEVVGGAADQRLDAYACQSCNAVFEVPWSGETF